MFYFLILRSLNESLEQLNKNQNYLSEIMKINEIDKDEIFVVYFCFGF